MSKRTIISIDEEKCNGCGLCIPNCPEGAMQVIDGKARLISDLFCDGLGACVGYCPEGAIALTEREAEPYDEAKAMSNIAPHGAGTIKAHLEHLAAHGEQSLLSQALAWLGTEGIAVPAEFTREHPEGSRSSARAAFSAGPRTAASSAAPASSAPSRASGPAAAPAPSALSNWPIQLHLLSPMAPRFQGADVLLSADCVAYAMGSFHSSLLDGRALAIACPKLDEGADIYREKLTALIDHAQIQSLTVVMMQVPCCRGLLGLAQKARDQAHRRIPLNAMIISIDDGSVLLEEAV